MPDHVDTDALESCTRTLTQVIDTIQRLGDKIEPKDLEELGKDCEWVGTCLAYLAYGERAVTKDG